MTVAGARIGRTMGPGDIEGAAEDAQIHFELALAYLEMDLLEDALGELETVVRLAPARLDAQAKLAEVRARMKPPRDEPPDDVA